MIATHRPLRHATTRRRRRRTVPPNAFSGTIFRLRPRLEWMEDRTLLSTFAVTDTADSGPGSFRQAILDSNAATGSTNAIDFDISGSGVQTIAPLSPLPAITSPVLIDGESQPGYAGMPLIELNGYALTTNSASVSPTGYYVPGIVDGLIVTGPDVTVRGLDIGGYFHGAGIHIEGAGATGEWVYGDFLGANPTGTAPKQSTTFANNYGVEIDDGAHDNLIGTNGDGAGDAAERNLVSGNQSDSVLISGQGTTGNVVAGNLIGTDITGTGELGYYGQAGVVIDSASGNTVGGTTASAGNIIGYTYYGESGVSVVGIGSVGNSILANRIFPVGGGNGEAPAILVGDAKVNPPIVVATADGGFQGAGREYA